MRVGIARALMRLTLAFLLALGACLPAGATALFEYRATCQFACANVGLQPGDTVGGLIAISDSALALGEVTSLYDIESFAIDFGEYHFGLSSLGTAFAVLSAGHDRALVFAFITSAPGNLPGYAFAQTAWAAGDSVFDAALGGYGTLRRVPEPASPLLLAAALVAIVVCRSRVRAQRVQGAATSASTP